MHYEKNYFCFDIDRIKSNIATFICLFYVICFILCNVILSYFNLFYSSIFGFILSKCKI